MGGYGGFERMAREERMASEKQTDIKTNKQKGGKQLKENEKLTAINAGDKRMKEKKEACERLNVKIKWKGIYIYICIKKIQRENSSRYWWRK